MQKLLSENENINFISNVYIIATFHAIHKYEKCTAFDCTNKHIRKEKYMSI